MRARVWSLPLATLLLSASAGAAADTVTFTGRLYHNDGAPARWAQVAVFGLSETRGMLRHAETDSAGFYRLEISPGACDSLLIAFWSWWGCDAAIFTAPASLPAVISLPDIRFPAPRPLPRPCPH